MSNQWLPSRALIRVATVRFLGGGLTLIGLIAGIHMLGAGDFGKSVVLLSAGMLLALPSTSAERLVLRLTASAGRASASQLIRSRTRYSVVVVGLGIVASSFLWLTDHEGWPAPTVASLAAASISEVALRQARARGIGALMWGQVPNELFRPLATLVGYWVAGQWPSAFRAELAVLIPSCLTLALILLAPRSSSDSVDYNREAIGSSHLGPLVWFTIISIIAALIERGYTIAVGAISDGGQVTLIAVGLRITQIGLFGQAFLLFYYSPGLARSLRGGSLNNEALTIVRKIRIASVATAAPVIGICSASPSWLVRGLGNVPGTRIALTITAIAIAAQVVTGPSQAALTMTDGEKRVAVVYVAGAAIGVLVFAASDHSGLSALTGILASYIFFSLGQLYFARRKFKHWI